MKRTLYIALFLLLLGAPHAHAQTGSSDLSVTPIVIDEKAKARDILKETIMLKNVGTHVLFLYPSVGDINPTPGVEKQVTVTDGAPALADSLTGWVELSRGVIELSPGEEKAVPFVIRVNFNAVPGEYHAAITFTNGSTREEADLHGPLSTVTVNVEVQADIKELLQLNKYTTDSMFMSGDDILFNYQLQNIGNQELTPKGEIRIYDRKGEEVADVAVNREGKVIAPDQLTQLASVWSAANGFGRYKALLTVDYGSSQTASVQDTTFFWIVPWKQLLTLFLITLIAIIVLSIQFHNWLERRHLYKFAHAGMLNEHAIKHLEVADEIPSMPIPTAVRTTPIPPPAPVLSPIVQPRSKFEKTEEVRGEHKSLRDVLRKEKHVEHGHAINLKKVTPEEHTPAHLQVRIPAATPSHANESHVISLKKQ